MPPTLYFVPEPARGYRCTARIVSPYLAELRKYVRAYPLAWVTA